ncbi:hypothetical protein TWF191_005790 [Orbilia oligospora]|uniref:HAUS augmin-like complex subunit 4 n=1 Tax=Orbilia oligospora TaxID=2813651 RepID=A0A7C8UZ02_ORBOL|nr:hypothetical protein TWF191_005790 [Orbilia oligospora]
MIPICPDEVLERNPQFKTVFQNLAVNKLNSDASTKLSNEGAKESEDVDKRLTTIREDLVKTKIIRQRLVHILNELPPDLREVIDLYLCSQNSGAVLRKDDEAFFLEGLPLICKALNKVILEDATDLANMCGGNAHITHRLQSLQSRRTHLYKLRTQSLKKTLHLTTLLRTQISTTIKLIEQTKHGLSSRAQKSQAKHLALVSESLEGKVKIMYFEQLDRIYDDDTTGALAFYKEHLEDVKVRLKKQGRKAEGELEEYEGFGEGVKRDVVRYAKVLDELERVTVEVQRLEGDF